MKSNLRVILFERRLSVREFSKMTGLAINTILKVYNNKFENTTFGVIKIMCSTLKISLSELIPDEEIKDNNDSEKKTLTSLKAG